MIDTTGMRALKKTAQKQVSITFNILETGLLNGGRERDIIQERQEIER